MDYLIFHVVCPIKASAVVEFKMKIRSGSHFINFINLFLWPTQE